MSPSREITTLQVAISFGSRVFRLLFRVTPWKALSLLHNFQDVRGRKVRVGLRLNKAHQTKRREDELYELNEYLFKLSGVEYCKVTDDGMNKDRNEYMTVYVKTVSGQQ